MLLGYTGLVLCMGHFGHEARDWRLPGVGVYIIFLEFIYEPQLHR